MSAALRVTLQPGEKIFVNGAVIRTDRKVGMEFLNNVTFLLETHVLQAEDAVTPLKQLYFVLQTMLMDPAKTADILGLFRQMHAKAIGSFDNREIVSELKFISGLVAAEKYFDALKSLRSLFSREAEIMDLDRASPLHSFESGGLVPCK
ncbi:flagellar biosynthesis repressor FlbT [soil metagenome]